MRVQQAHKYLEDGFDCLASIAFASIFKGVNQLQLVARGAEWVTDRRLSGRVGDALRSHLRNGCNSFKVHGARLKEQVESLIGELVRDYTSEIENMLRALDTFGDGLPHADD